MSGRPAPGAPRALASLETASPVDSASGGSILIAPSFSVRETASGRPARGWHCMGLGASRRLLGAAVRVLCRRDGGECRAGHRKAPNELAWPWSVHPPLAPTVSQAWDRGQGHSRYQPCPQGAPSPLGDGHVSESDRRRPVLGGGPARGAEGPRSTSGPQGQEPRWAFWKRCVWAAETWLRGQS